MVAKKQQQQPQPDLVHGAEDVSIILLEAADTGEARQSSRQLVPVQYAKICHSERQLPPGAWTMVKHQAVATEFKRGGTD